MAQPMLLIYINDMVKEVDNYRSFFTDDSKVMKKVEEEQDYQRWQEQTDKFHNLRKDREMEFNLKN